MEALNTRPAIAIAFGSLLLVHAAAGPGTRVREPRKKPATFLAAEGLGFDLGDRERIREFVRALPLDALPAGLSRHHRLPPGLEKQLRRHGRLPSGVDSRLTRFPLALENRLTPLPQEYARAFLSGRAVIYSRTTGEIADSFMPF